MGQLIWLKKKRERATKAEILRALGSEKVTVEKYLQVSAITQPKNENFDEIVAQFGVSYALAAEPYLANLLIASDVLSSKGGKQILLLWLKGILEYMEANIDEVWEGVNKDEAE